MKDQGRNLASPQAPGDARDILSRLYREIGISAVAAALQATESKPRNTEDEDTWRWMQRRFHDHAA